MNTTQAECIALNVLEWMGRHSELLTQFINQTGVSLVTIKHDAHQPELLAAVLDFLLTQNDHTISDCCQSLNIKPEILVKARMPLPGGAEFHWT